MGSKLVMRRLPLRFSLIELDFDVDNFLVGLFDIGFVKVRFLQTFSHLSLAR